MKKYFVAEPEIGQLEKKLVNECLDSGWISSSGKYINLFEKKFSNLCKTKYSIAVANGTVSLHLILLSLNIKKDEEIILPDFTYVATLNSILYVGAKPILVDCDPNTYNIDTKKIEEKINKKTRAIIIVHLFGNPCDLKKIKKIADKHKITLIEDAAEAHGATYMGKPVGGFGLLNSFSFFGNKTITTGEGGMITTNSKKIYEKIQLLKNQGQHKNDEKYYHRIMGFNYRMTNIQAAIGIAQLSNIKKFINKKRKINNWYKYFLSEVIKNNYIKFQKQTKHSRPSYWMNALTIEKKDTLKISQILKRKGIETRPFFKPMHTMPYLKQPINKDLKNSKIISNKGIILPSGTNLNKNDIKYISDALINAIK